MHRHGGDPTTDMQRLGIAARPILDFSVNVSPLGLPDALEKRWGELMDAAGHYPETGSTGVIRYYEHRFGLPPEYVLPGNGSIELIYLAPRALGIERAGVLSPSFYDYRRALFLAGAAVTQVHLLADEDFLIRPSRLANALDKTGALYICNPNNPTGTGVDADALIALADAYPDRYLLVDEAFVQFLDDWERATLLRPERLRPNLLVFHSLTKIFAVPGLRLGSVVSHPDTIAMLRRHSLPWSVNRVADQAASILAECEAEEETLREVIAGERRKISDRLSDCAGLRLFPAEANFFLARYNRSASLDELLKALLEQGIYVRDCRNFEGLEDGYFRFCIRLPRENDRLVSALMSACRA